MIGTFEAKGRNGIWLCLAVALAALTCVAPRPATADDDRESAYRDYAMKGAGIYIAGSGFLYQPDRTEKERAASTVAATAHVLLEAYKVDGAARWLEAARKSADSLIAHADMNGDGKYGWGRYWPSEASRGDSKGGATPFNRDCSAARDEAYGDEMFDVARVTHFLLATYDASHDAKYLEAARRAIDDTWDRGAETQGGAGFAYDKTAGPCSRGWHIKNINMLMAIPMAMLAKRSDDPRYRKRFDQMMVEEKAQFKGVENLGYYSNDVERAKGTAGGYVSSAQTASANAIVCNLKTGTGESCSAHLGLEARALYLVGRETGDENAYRGEIAALMNGFLAVDPKLCESEKTPRGIAMNSTSCIAHYCALRRFDRRYDDLCQERLSAKKPLTQDVFLGLFWGGAAPASGAK